MTLAYRVVPKRLVLLLLAVSTVFTWQARQNVDNHLFTFKARPAPFLMPYLKEGGLVYNKLHHRGGWEHRGAGVRMRTGIFDIRLYWVTDEQRF
jgi:hypothetical protein